MTKESWKDSTYLDTVERFAEIASRSRAIAEHFFGDKETCMMLIMQGDDWGVKPQIVLANSFYDQYGRIQQTGLLMQMIIASSPEVDSMKIEYLGNWNNILEMSTRIRMENPIKNWMDEDEQGCGIEIQITLGNGKEFNKSIFLDQLNNEYRALNPSWALSPKKQLFNHLMRDIGNYELRSIVNGYDTQEASFEHDYSLSLKEHVQPVTEYEKQEVTEEEMAMFSPTSSDEDNDNFSEKQAESFYIDLKDKLETFFDTCNELSDSDIQKSVDELSKAIAASKPILNDDQLSEIKRLYIEVQQVVNEINIK